jgi:serine/threonine protein kinase
VYQAERAGERVLLKVAHEGFEERLKREAGVLLALQKNKREHPVLPALVPAYLQADLATYPYGRAVLGGHTLHYIVLAPREGETLRGILLKDPQPWYQHAVWLTLSLADAVAMLHSNGLLHLCLSPEMVLVHRGLDGIPRPVLLDLGAVTPPERASTLWQRRFCFPAYRAPELLQATGGRVGAFSDVYGVALILHEMLSGGPAYPFRLRAEAEVVQNVLHASPAVANRPDLENVPRIIEQAISKNYRRRPPDILTLARDLQANVPPVPKEPQKRRVNWGVATAVSMAVLAIVLLLVLAAAVGG